MFVMVCNTPVSLKKVCIELFVLLGVILFCLLRHNNDSNKIVSFLVTYLQ